MEQNIYDNNDFFKGYQSKRGELSANDLIEIPELFELIGDVKDLTVLDLGCGAGGHDRKLAKMGAKRILGIDLSNNMINEAKKNNDSNIIEYRVMSMNDIDTLEEKYDLVVSSLAIHYIEDYDTLCKKVYNLLNDGGRFVFSMGHPMDNCVLLNGYSENYVVLNDKKYYLISDYNNEGKRVSHWYVDGVETYYKNVSHLINGLIDAGFILEHVTESYATEDAIKLNPKFIDQKDHSYFIYFKCRKEKI